MASLLRVLAARPQPATPTLPSHSPAQHQAPTPTPLSSSSSSKGPLPATLPRLLQATQPCQLAPHLDLLMAHPQ